MKILLRYLHMLFFIAIANASLAVACVKGHASQAIEKFASNHKIQAVYAVADHGRIALHGAQGFYDFEKNKRLTVNEQMAIASGTKPLTATAILLLQDRKLLNVNDTIAKHLSTMWDEGKMPEWAHKIKIHHLLTHSSGLPEYVYTFKINENATQDVVNRDILHFVGSKELEFKPGSKFTYNNTGYMMLGVIVERVSGQKFADFMKKELFEPNGMKNTRIVDFKEAIKFQYGSSELPTRYYVTPNSTKNPKFTPVGHEIIVAPNGDCGAISTVEDLIQWNKALHGGKILSKKLYKKMIYPYFKSEPNGDYETHIGYGMYISKMHNGQKIYHHEGRALGIRSDNGYLPQKDISYAIISNSMVYVPKEIKDKIDFKNPDNQLDISYFRNAILESL